jgi:hypothetical protein
MRGCKAYFGYYVAVATASYRAGPGAEKAQLLNDNHAKMVTAKRRQKELALALNATKGRIDALRQQQEQLKAARLAEGGEDAQVGCRCYVMYIFTCGAKHVHARTLRLAAVGTNSSTHLSLCAAMWGQVGHLYMYVCVDKLLPCGCRC